MDPIQVHEKETKKDLSDQSILFKSEGSLVAVDLVAVSESLSTALSTLDDPKASSLSPSQGSILKSEPNPSSNLSSFSIVSPVNGPTLSGMDDGQNKNVVELSKEMKGEPISPHQQSSIFTSLPYAVGNIIGTLSTSTASFLSGGLSTTSGEGGLHRSTSSSFFNPLQIPPLQPPPPYVPSLVELEGPLSAKLVQDPHYLAFRMFIGNPVFLPARSLLSEIHKFQAELILLGCSEGPSKIYSTGASSHSGQNIPALDAVARELRSFLARAWRIVHSSVTTQQPPSPSFSPPPESPSVSEDHVLHILDGLESYIILRNYSLFIESVLRHEAEADFHLSQRLSLLRVCGFGLEHVAAAMFGVMTLGEDANDNPVYPRIFREAGFELLLVNSSRTPKLKLACLKGVHQIIIKILRENTASLPRTSSPTSSALPSSSPSADTLLPMLIYLIYSINPPRLLSNLKFIQAYMSPEMIDGYSSYVLTNFSAAISFLQSFDVGEVFGVEDFPPQSPLSEPLSEPKLDQTPSNTRKPGNLFPHFMQRKSSTPKLISTSSHADAPSVGAPSSWFQFPFSTRKGGILVKKESATALLSQSMLPGILAAKKEDEQPIVEVEMLEGITHHEPRDEKDQSKE